jgi:hypothetical protein
MLQYLAKAQPDNFVTNGAVEQGEFVKARASFVKAAQIFVKPRASFTYSLSNEHDKSTTPSDSSYRTSSEAALIFGQVTATSLLFLSDGSFADLIEQTHPNVLTVIRCWRPASRSASFISIAAHFFGT